MALAPITANVTDCSYAVPVRQLHGVTELEEHGGSELASAAGATRAQPARSAESFIELEMRRGNRNRYGRCLYRLWKGEGGFIYSNMIQI